MEIKDILELARLGYKPNDIKELLSFKPADPDTDDSKKDLNPGDSDDSDKKKEPKEDPIDAIIKREKEEKE